MEVPDIIIDIILETCTRIKRENQEYFNTVDLLQAICRHNEYEH